MQRRGLEQPQEPVFHHQIVQIFQDEFHTPQPLRIEQHRIVCGDVNLLRAVLGVVQLEEPGDPADQRIPQLLVLHRQRTAQLGAVHQLRRLHQPVHLPSPVPIAVFQRFIAQHRQRFQRLVPLEQRAQREQDRFPQRERRLPPDRAAAPAGVRAAPVGQQTLETPAQSVQKSLVDQSQRMRNLQQRFRVAPFVQHRPGQQTRLRHFAHARPPPRRSATSSAAPRQSSKHARMRAIRSSSAMRSPVSFFRK